MGHKRIRDMEMYARIDVNHHIGLRIRENDVSRQQAFPGNFFASQACFVSTCRVVVIIGVDYL